MKVAIMQPTFIPWMGYLGMIDCVDKFIFLDSVQFAKRSWQQRNRIKTPNGELMLSVPALSKGASDQLIKDVKINNTDSSFRKLLLTIKQNYVKTPYFSNYFEQIESVFHHSSENLCDLNIQLILFFMKTLGIDQNRILRSSEMNSSGKKGNLLAHLAYEVGGSVYVSAPGSKVYLDEDPQPFIEKNIEIVYYDFKHPTYPQLYGDFLPYMSIIDALFNCGADETMKLIKSGIPGGLK